MGPQLQSPSRSNWRVEVAENWDVLGPFPIHAREQHFLSPSYPLNLTEPIDLSAKWPSAYADGGQVGWSTAQSQNGTLNLSYPHIRWASIRATEGWAALQHHSVLRTSITVYPPPEGTSSQDQPHLLIDIKQGSFFALRPSETETAFDGFVPQWHAGNIYAIDASPPHLVPLPVEPATSKPTVYDLFVSGDYEIRLFGDPTVSGSEVPTLTISLDVKIEEPQNDVFVATTHHILPDFVDNWAFGDAVGVGLRSSAGWWTVKQVILVDPNPEAFNLRLLENTRIAPGQTRIVPLAIEQKAHFSEDQIRLEVHLTSESDVKLVVPISLPLKKVSRWLEGSDAYQPFVATYFYATSTPTPFVVIPPKATGPTGTKAPLLFLHGAGLNVLTTPSWGCEAPRQPHSWIIMPTGRTSWGLDWHGPSAEDAWASVSAFSTILERHPQWSAWSFPKRSRVLLLGHSNGGQGAWYVAERYPDRILGVVPVAAYIKAQAYVPLVQSRSAYFIDPALRAILETSLTPDDNDLFVTNLAGTPVYAVHGGADENVPVWHTRALIDTLKSWDSNANVTFKEDAGEPHCYNTAFNNSEVQAFIDRIVNQDEESSSIGWPFSFTLTVSVPSESDSLHGFKVLKLQTPGRLARLSVKTDTRGVHITPRNVVVFSLDVQAAANLRDKPLYIAGNPVKVPARQETYFFIHDNGQWKVRADSVGVTVQPSGRVSRILASNAPIVIVIPDENNEYYLHAAVRLAHDLDVYHKLSAEIVDASDALERLDAGTLGTGNLVTIGDSHNAFTRRLLEEGPTPFKITNASLAFRGKALPGDTSSIFLHPHPVNSSSLVLTLHSNSVEGTERLLRLFPIRTGITVPDWLIINQGSDSTGAAGVEGAGVWGNEWSWNEGLSFI